MKRISMQLHTDLDEESLKTVEEIARLSVFGLTNSELARERAVGNSHNAGLRGQPIPTDKGLLIDPKEAANLLDISPRLLWTLYNSGQMPAPIKIGRLVKFSYSSLVRWVEDGCPDLRKT